MRHLYPRVILTLVTLALVLAVVPLPSAHADGLLVVTTTSMTFGDDGKCTLPEAIENANSNSGVNLECGAGSGTDTITFNIPSSEPGCIGTNFCVISLLNYKIIPTGNLIIDGDANAASITLDAESTSPIFLVNAGVNLTMDGLELKDGADVRGGAGKNNGTLTLTDCILGGNIASEKGGAIENTGTLNITRCFITGNQVNPTASNIAAEGGAINNLGTLSVTETTFIGNSIQNTGDAVSSAGGAIYANGDTHIDRSLFNGNYITIITPKNKVKNKAPEGSVGVSVTGGAIGNASPLYDLFIYNTTFFENTASLDGPGSAMGGAIYTYSLDASNLTFSRNGVQGVNGAGAFGSSVRLGISGPVIRNSIFANSLIGSNCSFVGTPFATDDLSDDNSCGTSTQVSSSNLALTGIGYYGGNTLMVALGNTSAAIDAGDRTTCADPLGVNSIDQRGAARNDLECDSGAFEFVYSDGHTVVKDDSVSPSASFGPTLAVAYNSLPGTVTVNREPTTPPNSPPANALDIAWDISASGSFDGSIYLCYNPNTDLNGQDESQLHLWHYSGGTWNDIGGALESSIYLPYHCIYKNGINSLSPFAIAPASTTATYMRGFDARLTRTNDVKLKWRTLNESFMAGFDVYRKTKHGTWTKLNSELISAKSPGAAIGASYAYRDQTVEPNTRYKYRLQLFSTDNHTEHSRTIKIKTP